MTAEPSLIAGKNLKKNTDYWLTGEYYLGGRCLHNTKVCLARKFKPAGFKHMFAVVIDGEGIEYVIHPDSSIFTEEDKRGK